MSLKSQKIVRKFLGGKSQTKLGPNARICGALATINIGIVTDKPKLGISGAREGAF